MFRIRVPLGKGRYLYIGPKGISFNTTGTASRTTVGTRGVSQTVKGPGGFNVSMHNGRPTVRWSSARRRKR